MERAAGGVGREGVRGRVRGVVEGRLRWWGVVVMLPVGAAAADKPAPLISVPVANRHLRGQVCPIGATDAWTVEHVSSLARENEPSGRPWPLIFTNPDGSGGTVLEVLADQRRDLSRVKVVEGGAPFARWLSVAAEAPLVGDTVVVQGYDFEAGYTPRTVKSKILRLGEGTIYFRDSPGPGSSGSCVVLERTGEVVGVNYAVFAGRRDVGLAWAVYGAWGEIPEVFAETALSGAER